VRGSKFKPIVRESKFRYISGKALHASTQYTHINDVAKKNTGESNVLQVSRRRRRRRRRGGDAGTGASRKRITTRENSLASCPAGVTAFRPVRCTWRCR